VPAFENRADVVRTGEQGKLRPSAMIVNRLAAAKGSGLDRLAVRNVPACDVRSGREGTVLRPVIFGGL